VNGGLFLAQWGEGFAVLSVDEGGDAVAPVGDLAAAPAQDQEARGSLWRTDENL
jgi:regulator of RNase E activity RraA